jgi:GNAT superfamily N-acetyltransferase
MTELANGYSTRAAALQDVAELTDLVNEYWEVLTGIVKFSIDELKNMLLTPGFDMESSLQVVLSPQEEIVACGMVMDLSNPPVHPNVYGCVRQGYEGRGLGTTILNWAEKRAAQALQRCPDHARVSMHVQTAPSHQATVHLLEKQGLTPVRYSWIMMKERFSRFSTEHIVGRRYGQKSVARK